MAEAFEYERAPLEFSPPVFGEIDERILRDVERYAPASGWIARTLATVSDEPPTPPELVEGLLYAGKRHVFSGPQESAKTIAAYVCGLTVVRNGAPIVLLDFEMGEYDAKRRFRELGATDEQLERVSYLDPQSPADPDAIAGLIELRPALVILDAAAGAFQVDGLDDNSRRDVEVWAQTWINPFWRAQIATLVLDHVTKNAETRGNYAIGSERKVGGVDVHIGFSVVEAIKRGETGRYKVVTHKDRGGFLKRGKLAEFALRSDPESHSLSWEWEWFVESEEGAGWFPYHVAEKVSRYLEMQTEAVSMSDVVSVVQGKKETLIDAVNGLVREGFVTETAGPRKARMFELVTVFREASFRPVPDPFPPVPDLDETTRSPFPLSREERNRSTLGGGNGSQRSLDDEAPEEPPYPF